MLRNINTKEQFNFKPHANQHQYIKAIGQKSNCQVNQF